MQPELRLFYKINNIKKISSCPSTYTLEEAEKLVMLSVWSVLARSSVEWFVKKT